MITIQDFQKMELRVGKIISAKAINDSDKLYELEVNVGNKIKLVAGIRQHYTPEQLKNKKIIVVTNLEPAVIRGVESQGMLLAAENNGKIVLLTPDKDIEPGAKIR